jgi:hypothetical protein
VIRDVRRVRLSGVSDKGCESSGSCLGCQGLVIRDVRRVRLSGVSDKGCEENPFKSSPTPPNQIKSNDMLFVTSAEHKPLAKFKK